MSLIKAVKRQIKRYGFKGAASLIKVTSTSDPDSLEVSLTEASPIPLLSYAGKYPSDVIDGTVIFINDRKVLAVPDDDWNGSISEEDKVVIDGLTYEIIAFSIKRVKATLAYVEIQCRG